MKTFAGKIVLLTLLWPLAAAPQTSAPSKVNPQATTPSASPQTAAPAIAPRPVPSPTPTPAKLPQTIAPAVNQPKAAPGPSNPNVPAGVSAMPAAGAAPGAVAARPMLGRADIAQAHLQPIQRNPKLSERGMRTQMLALLTQQKQAADLLRRQITPAKGVGTKFDASGLNKPQSAGSAVDASPAPPAQSSKGSNVLVNSGVSMAPEVDPLACARAYPAPLIFSINSKKTGVVFTTDPATNYFVLRGCNFGNTKGSAYLMGGFKAGPIPFAIESWDDTWIIGKVRPDLKGEWDQDGVSLRIVKANAQSYDFQGYSFYAAREQQFVVKFYKEQIQLGSPCDPSGNPGSCYYVSPEPGRTLPCWPGFCTWPTITVYRTTSDTQFYARSGTDSYVLNGLAPGFVIGAVELATYSDKHQGWLANVSDSGVSVSFVYGHKEGQKEEQYDASYSMSVFLSGPLGCQPF